MDCGRGLAARVLPVLRGPAGQAHRLLAVRGASRASDKPAITTEEKQLCVEGLKHGERYAITLRAGLPSTVQETLHEVRRLHDLSCATASPSVRFTGKAYVLPRDRPARHSAGQREHRLRVKVQIYRIGDRNLIDTVLGSDFQRTLDRYDAEQARNEKRQHRSGTANSTIESALNADVDDRVPDRSGDRRPRSPASM